MRRYLSGILLFVFLSGLSTGCGPDTRDTERYQTRSGAPAILTNPEQHRGGFGRNECLVCHNSALNLHRNPDLPIDVDQLNTAIRDNGEAAYCLTCHGTNGT